MSEVFKDYVMMYVGQLERKPVEFVAQTFKTVTRSAENMSIALCLRKHAKCKRFVSVIEYYQHMLIVSDALGTCTVARKQ